jgi:hypothetical protein
MLEETYEIILAVILASVLFPIVLRLVGYIQWAWWITLMPLAILVVFVVVKVFVEHYAPDFWEGWM